MSKGICSVPQCREPHDSKGYCGRHYMVWRRHGDPLWKQPTLSELFWRKVVEAGDCWLWTASGKQYGKFGGEGGLAHRFAYEDMVGPIPDGLTIDHLCNNKRCVNPSHLEPVSMAENIRRADLFYGIRSAVTQCPHGHSYDEANTARRNGRRHCRACDRERARIIRERRKASSCPTTISSA